jgi:hypothetical protein
MVFGDPFKTALLKEFRMSESQRLTSDLKWLKDTIKKDIKMYQESNLYTLSIESQAVITTKGSKAMSQCIMAIVQSHIIINK